MNLHVRKATDKDIDTLLQITKACAQYMITKQIFQWNENYPNREIFEKDILREELYVLISSAKVVGCIVVSTLMDEEYKSAEKLKHKSTF